MSITTGGGDKGWTGLLFEGRARKDDPRIEAVGALDEACSWIGLAKTAMRSAADRRLLHACQEDLFIVGSECVTLPRNVRRLKLRIGPEHVNRLEVELRRLEKALKLEGCCFLIPGENRASALLDVARCVVRRAERRVTTLRRGNGAPNPLLPVYLNRLSDLLYLLARKAEKKRGVFVARKV